MRWQDRIWTEPTVCQGRPCVKGTRILVSTILDHLAAGQSPDEILKNYRLLSRDDIRAALAYASELTRVRVPPETPPVPQAAPAPPPTHPGF
jgi:uncharacterized protein (DUF433 family)